MKMCTSYTFQKWLVGLPWKGFLHVLKRKKNIVLKYLIIHYYDYSHPTFSKSSLVPRNLSMLNGELVGHQGLRFTAGDEKKFEHACFLNGWNFRRCLQRVVKGLISQCYEVILEGAKLFFF